MLESKTLLSLCGHVFGSDFIFYIQSMFPTRKVLTIYTMYSTIPVSHDL